MCKEHYVASCITYIASPSICLYGMCLVEKENQERELEKEGEL